jgi:putative acetyltransferase
MAQTGERRFRQADPEDAADVLAIKQAAIESTDGTYSDTQVDAWSPDDDALSTFEGAIEREQFVVLLATVDGDPAGYGVLNVDATRIDAVFVDPEYTGRGLGSSLVGQLETRARMLGLTDLTVVSSRNARRFYESLGYEVTDSRTRTIEGVELGFVAVEKAIDG